MNKFSIFDIQKELERKLAHPDLQGALDLIQKTVERVFDEPINTAQIFGNKMLDIYSQRIGALSLPQAPSGKPLSETHIYITTKLQKSGGHTRVVEDLIRAAPKNIRHVILSTELLGLSDRQQIENNLKDENAVFEWNEARTSLSALLWLQKRVRELAPEKVWLFNHHQDAAAVAAVQPDETYKTIFYHHGDHHLCLGVYLPFAAHIDPLPMGYHHCRNELGIENTYLPLWMKDLGDRTNSLFMKDGTATTCTAARSNKVEVPYFTSYVEMIPSIIEATGGKHIHIGKLTPWALWKIHRRLKTRGIDTARFIYKTWTPGIWRELQEHNVDLYISSFPYAGARTLIEALGSATPVAIHDHYATRMLACVEMVYPEAFAWRDPNELITYLRRLTPQNLANQSRQARNHFLLHHDMKNFNNKDPSMITDLVAPALRPHHPDKLQRALDIVRQITFLGLLWRIAYRRRRLIKKIFSD